MSGFAPFTEGAPIAAPTRSGLAAILPMIVGTALLCAGNGLLTTLVGLNLVRGAVPAAAVQPIVTGYPLGFMLGCLAARPLIVWLQHPRAFALLTLVTALATIGLSLPFSALAWTLLRVVNGFCLAGCFTTVESWVNLSASRHRRGGLLACYMVATSLGLSVGQAMLGLGTEDGKTLFWLAGATMASSGLPLLFGERTPKRVTVDLRTLHATMRFRAFLLVAPLAVLAAVQAGMTNLNFLSVAPIYGAMIGLKTTEVGSLVIAFSLGGLCIQPLVGWLSDRLDRRALLAAMAMLGATLCVVIAACQVLPLWILLPMLFACGCTTLSIYPLGLAIAASRVEPSVMVSLSGKFLLVYSFGSVVSPAISTALMQRFAPRAMFGYMACLVGTVALASLVGLFGRRRSPAA